MKKLLLTLLLCEMLFAIESAKDLAVKEALDASHKLHEMMSENVKNKIANQGIYAGAEFCVNESYAKIEELNKSLGDNITIKRVSLQNRNPKSYPLEDEVKILEAFDLIEKSSAYLPSEIVQLNSDGEYKIYFPSTMSNKSCKSCHGANKGVDIKVQELIKSKYPNDKAIDFVSGQVRGAVIVTVKPKK